MTYEVTVSYFFNIPSFTKKNEPQHTREFMERLGNPQEQFPSVHVAGSNGKGSVCAFLSSILRESGLRTGMFASPHLTDIRERFLINGQPCTREQFLEAEQFVRRTVVRMQKEGMPHPTFFEYLFGVGMVLFWKEGVECAVLETGLGGRLDATNVVRHPILTILTSISLEHTEILGNTIEQIAAEKAGIIKKGVPVLFDGNEPLAEPVIRNAVGKNQAPVTKVSWEDIKILLNDGKNIDFSMDCGYDVTNIRIPFPAKYQAMNAALALAAVPFLRRKFEISNEAVLQGFRKASWPGRMEETEPEVYMDGAHNVSGIRGFLEAVDSLAKCPSILLFSMVQEKDYEEASRLLCQKDRWERIILTKISGNARALDPECLKSCMLRELSRAGKHIPVLVIECPREAYREAMEQKKPGQKLFCAGSLYLIGELKNIAAGT